MSDNPNANEEQAGLLLRRGIMAMDALQGLTDQGRKVVLIYALGKLDSELYVSGPPWLDDTTAPEQAIEP